jgi:DNA-binding MarR family transcriptional regulator
MTYMVYTMGKASNRGEVSMPSNTDWLTQQEIAVMTGKEIREVREVVRNLRRAGVIQTTVSPEDERVILVHKNSLDTVKAALRATA